MSLFINLMCGTETAAMDGTLTSAPLGSSESHNDSVGGGGGVSLPTPL